MQIRGGAPSNFESQMDFYILNKLWYLHQTRHKHTQMVQYMFLNLFRLFQKEKWNEKESHEHLKLLKQFD